MALSRPETRPISIRLTAEERTRLETAAAGTSLSAYAREKLLGSNTHLEPIRVPTVEERVVARTLAALGQSEIAASLRDLSEAAKNGLLPVDEETVQLIEGACNAVHELRDELIGALGLRRRGQR